jgi:hypothetical protein
MPNLAGFWGTGNKFITGSKLTIMPNDDPSTGSGRDLQEFLKVVRQALLIVVYWIEDKYHLPPPTRYRDLLAGRRPAN